ncbi:MAG: DNA-directed DNA polymerase II small subunit [Candidatus Anstonellaceae archaeon]
MKEDIDYLYSKNIRLTKKAFDFLIENKISKATLDAIIKKCNFLVNLEDVLEELALEKKFKEDRKIEIEQKVELPKGEEVYVHKESQKEKKEECPEKDEIKPKTGLAIKEVEILRSSSFKPIAKDYDSKIEILQQEIQTTTYDGDIETFVSYFRDRFNQEASILKTRQSNLPILRLDQLTKNVGQQARIIAMVYEKRITSKGNLVLEVEDEYGKARVVVPSTENCFLEAQTILKDDILAIEGKILENMFIAKSIFWPDISVLKTIPSCQEDLAIVYLSDLHFGSRYFLEKAFRRFLRWLEGKEGNEKLASKVKYIIIAGDIVDGIGVYPTQENDLTIKDISLQYKEFEKSIEQIPDYISVIVGPGNHDGVRRGEPQPPLDKSLISLDIHLIGSPAMVKIEKFNHLIYHGTSLDSIIANLPGLSYSKPEAAMKELLKRRHLSPLYGDNLIVPSSKDLMVIPQEPDVLHMGHIHKNGSAKYRGVLMINSGTYQDRTDYQIKMGHIPTPAITPVLELKSGQLHHLKFLEEGGL